MSLSQGGESNFNGRWLEENVEWHFKNRKIPILDYSDDLGNGHLFHASVLVRRVPYISIYGCHSTSEFVFHHRGRSTRIECRVQETAGSVDEKFPYLFKNARERMPEQNILLLLHGEGARKEATDWLRRQCRMVEDKSIRVVTLSEFGAWLKLLLKEAVTP